VSQPTPVSREKLKRILDEMDVAMGMFGRAAAAAFLGGSRAWHEVLHRERYSVETDPGPLDAGLLMSWDRGYAEARDDDWEEGD
jgi:hypothetical protein